MPNIPIQHFTKQKILTFVLFFVAFFSGKDSASGMARWLDLGSNTGAIFFMLYLFCFLLFEIPLHVSRIIGLYSLLFVMLLVVLQYHPIAEDVAIFGFSVLILNTLMLLRELKNDAL